MDNEIKTLLENLLVIRVIERAEQLRNRHHGKMERKPGEFEPVDKVPPLDVFIDQAMDEVTRGRERIISGLGTNR